MSENNWALIIVAIIMTSGPLIGTIVEAIIKAKSKAPPSEPDTIKMLASDKKSASYRPSFFRRWFLPLWFVFIMLMPATSLYLELQNTDPLTRRDVVSIAVYVVLIAFQFFLALTSFGFELYRPFRTRN